MCAPTVARSSAPKRSATLTTKVRPSQPQRTRTCACAASVDRRAAIDVGVQRLAALVAGRVVDGVEHELVGGGLDAAHFLVAEAEARGVGEQRGERLVLVGRAADEALLDRRAGEQVGRRARRAACARSTRRRNASPSACSSGPSSLASTVADLAPGADLGHDADDVGMRERLHQPMARVDAGEHDDRRVRAGGADLRTELRWRRLRIDVEVEQHQLELARRRARQERRPDRLAR